MTPAQLKRISELTGVSEEQVLARMAQLEQELQVLQTELIAAYAAHGIEVSSPPPSPWGETMVCASHDDVLYCMDAHGKPENLPHGITHRALIIERHHALVKAVSDYCKAHAPGPIWVLAGGGGQLQAFFGNHTGYLAILYLTMEKGSLDAYDEVALELVGNTQFTLQVNWAKNDELFEGFNVPGIQLRTHREFYGA